MKVNELEAIGRWGDDEDEPDCAADPQPIAPSGVGLDDDGKGSVGHEGDKEDEPSVIDDSSTAVPPLQPLESEANSGRIKGDGGERLMAEQDGNLLRQNVNQCGKSMTAPILDCSVDHEDEPSVVQATSIVPQAEGTFVVKKSPRDEHEQGGAVAEVKEDEAIGRLGDMEGEPVFTQEEQSVVEPKIEVLDDESPSIGRSGDDEEEPSETRPTITVAPEDDGPLQSPDNPEKVSSGGENDDGGTWLAGAGRLVLWGVLIWLGLQIMEVVGATFAMPLVLRVPALTAELAVVIVLVFWITRIAKRFVSFQKCDDANLPSYYQRLSQSNEFVKELPDKERDAFLSTVKELSVIRDNYRKEWIQKCNDFEKQREKGAIGIVKEHALLTAVKTATSPWKIVDVLAVFYNSTRMVERLAHLYGHQCSRQQAFRLICGWGFNLYVAGRLGDIMEKGADMTVEKAIDILKNSDNRFAWLAQVLPVAGKIFAKAGEGATNYFLCYRLGKQAIETFKPPEPSE